MKVSSIARYGYSRAHLSLKRVRYNYYIKNWLDCKHNVKALQEARKNVKHDLVNKNPLVSVRIPTYNRGELLIKRTIPSVLNQTYQNFEIIIIGDHCTDNTETLVKNIHDERIKFYNLPIALQLLKV